ncbi:unnamed protein product [Paramecium octaurelia]|uniref:non-specific serine/threonine protein kinase n=1 Tax=Paramecium octaurelia TaxID=43137 RepID=A0A8S1VK24_PAROT|nr:unnamed protein product [Paramecium octaurelia]
MGCASSDSASANNPRKLEQQKEFTGEKISSEIFVDLKDGNIYEEYEVRSTLGEGAFGCVKLVAHRKTKMPYAMKQIKKQGLIKEDQKILFSEMDILRLIDHPNIVKLHKLYQDNIHYYMVTELCQGGELFDKLASEKNFTEKKAAEIMKQVLSAVTYCHERKIIHRDLKLENILLETKSANSNIKVIDFGTSRKVQEDEKLKLKIGTLYYMAPEVFQGQYDLKVDVWSVGVILYILLCGYPPFNGDDTTIKKKIQKGTFEFNDTEWRSISQEAKDLITKMLKFDPQQRITAQQALQDPWIQSKAPSNPVQPNALNNLKNFYSTSKLKNAIQLFIVTQVTTYQEKEEQLKQFKAMDTDGNGTISPDELKKHYSKHYGQEQAEKLVQEIMKQVDINQSGQIDFNEFLVAAVNKEKILSQEKLKQVFQMFDKNGDGKIQRAELQYIMSGIKIDDGQWKNILEECDKDNDGEISLDELITLMQKLK